MTQVTAPALSDPMHAAFEALRRDSDRVFGSRRVQIVPLSCETRESSEVARARVTTPTGVRHIFAKRLAPRRADASGLSQAKVRLRSDFEVTRRVFEAMRFTSDLRAVEPLACYEDLLCIVTREATGVRLDVLTGRDARWPVAPEGLSSLLLAMNRIGRWIAAFQRIPADQPSGRISLDDAREYLDVRLKRLLAIPRAGFDEARRRELLDYFDRRAAEVARDELAAVPVHGDITPSNIIVSPEHITVLDFAMIGSGSRCFDVTRLYTQLDFYTAKPQYRPHVIAELQRALLAGFDERLRPGHPLFDIYTVQHVVCHFLSHARQPGRFPASVYSRHQCHLHRRWLRAKARTTTRDQWVPAAPAAV